MGLVSRSRVILGLRSLVFFTFGRYLHILLRDFNGFDGHDGEWVGVFYSLLGHTWSDYLPEGAIWTLEALYTSMYWSERPIYGL